MVTWMELVSKGAVATCYNRSHRAWQGREEAEELQLEWHGSSIMAEVCQEGDPLTVLQPQAAQCSETHRMQMLLSSGDLRTFSFSLFLIKKKSE